MTLDPCLLHSDVTHTAMLELTSRCNLRCVYCLVSQPSYQGRDFDLSHMDDLIRCLQQRGVKVLGVSGHGETTMLPSWTTLCRRLIENGIQLHLITNLARDLSDDEADVLARFTGVRVSCDTTDPVLFRQMRRGGDLVTVLKNMAKIKWAASVNHTSPGFAWSVVVTDKNVFQLRELVRVGLGEGVTQFDFLNLTKYADVKGPLNVYHISTLPIEQMRQAKAAIQEAIEIVHHAGKTVAYQAGLLDVLEERLALNDTAAVPNQPENSSYRITYASEGKAGWTRDCFDPWTFAFIQADRTVLPCCWHEPVGKLTNETQLDQVLNGRPIQELRERLLTGALDPACVSCPARAWIETGTFREKFRNYQFHEAGGTQAAG